jgi:vitamin B12 transporter
VSYQYFDARNDAFFDGTTFQTTTVELGSYQLFNFLFKQELIKNRLSFFGTVTNILKEEFTENVGYATRGRNFRVGLNITL